MRFIPPEWMGDFVQAMAGQLTPRRPITVLGGTLNGKSYMLSVTFNAPKEAFDDTSEPFFAGGSVDDLLRPMHLNAKFFAMQPLPTFAAFDVMKNPEIEADFARFDAHLKTTFAEVEHVPA